MLKKIGVFIENFHVDRVHDLNFEENIKLLEAHKKWSHYKKSLKF